MRVRRERVKDHQSSLQFWQKVLRRWYQWKISLSRIEAHCRSMGLQEQRANLNLTNDLLERKRIGTVQVSCVQRTIRPVKRIEEYIDMLHSFINQAAKQGSQMVIFPEYNFLDLFGFIPGFSILNRSVNQSSFRKIGSNHHFEQGNTKDTAQAAASMSPVALFTAIAEPVEQGLEAIFSYLSKGYGMYIYTGSYVTEENGVLFNIGSLYGPDGQRVGRQKKLHLTDMEEQFGMQRGTRLELVDLPIGKVVIPICMDATYFETFQLANNLGAEMVIVPIANPEEYHFWKALKGIWPRVQESHLFGLKASLTGWFMGMHYTGKAGIFAPMAMTLNRDGVLAFSAQPVGDELVTAMLDFESLRKEREHAEYFGDYNPEYEREYVERTYFREKEV